MPIFYIYFPVLFLFLVFVSLVFSLYLRLFLEKLLNLGVFMIVGV